MKPNTSLEQGVCAMLMLASQKDHSPVRSEDMAIVLGISDSYLKKTLRKLVVAGLVTSAPLRGGGFSLARDARDITLADAFEALGGEISPKVTDLPDRVFSGCPHIDRGKAVYADAIAQAESAYMSKLAKVSLADFLKPEALAEGAACWADVAKEHKQL